MNERASTGAGAPHVAVVGAGWAGLAAAVEATQLGARVHVFEMAPGVGGRARDVAAGPVALDNGQHIAIGAYTETLRLMRTVGVAEAEAFVRQPLALVGADGKGLRLPPGHPLPAFVRGVLAQRGWSLRERLALLAAAARWAANRFACAPSLSVSSLTAGLPVRVQAELIEPLCVAALNTPAHQASAAVFLRVIRDALFAGAGSSDLLLPKVGLGAAFPEPAARWLRSAGATLSTHQRVTALRQVADGWQVDAATFDGVIVAASASEAARLLVGIDSAWSRQAGSLAYEPIVTVYATSAGTRLPAPMLALAAGAERPAQFVFDRGQLGGPAGMLAFVVSGAGEWLARGIDECVAATLEQAAAELGAHMRTPLEVVRVITEKRATFRCTPGLQRPAGRVADRLQVSGDYVAGPYPATLEGAVRSGVEAARQLARELGLPGCKSR
ncbi:hydroxysqualene dehydroxylase HpnE [Piscinibacter koreensis]|uniref:FAD-dependent oxidoreductase n=1 Tax=Piscinibacter koreensis TaxID=2742824 RepID=A0A7Y6NN18_9BURK|nr:FAD-dependent oxidoreductase [Schlegelella koreensis]